MSDPTHRIRSRRAASGPPSGESPNAGNLRFSLLHEQRGTVARVRVRGELDLATGPVFEREVEAHLSGPITTLVLDFTGVTYIDSSGVRSLLRIHGLAARQG